MPLHLEAFDAIEPAPEPATGPSPDWLDGHAAGYAEGQAQAEAAALETGVQLSGELVQSLQDMAFTYAEAREQVLASLGPLFGLLADRLLPAMASASFSPWIVETLLAAARADSSAPLSVELHPDSLGHVQACLPPGLPATLRPDPTLGPHAARLRLPDRESALDLDECLAALREALAPLVNDTAGKLRHYG